MTSKYVSTNYRRKYLRARRKLKAISKLKPQGTHPHDQYASLVDTLMKIKGLAE